MFGRPRSLFARAAALFFVPPTLTLRTATGVRRRTRSQPRSCSRQVEAPCFRAPRQPSQVQTDPAACVVCQSIGPLVLGIDTGRASLRAASAVWRNPSCEVPLVDTHVWRNPICEVPLGVGVCGHVCGRLLLLSAGPRSEGCMLGALSARGRGNTWAEALPGALAAANRSLLSPSPSYSTVSCHRGVYTDGSGTRSHGALFASILIYFYSTFYGSELIRCAEQS